MRTRTRARMAACVWAAAICLAAAANGQSRPDVIGTWKLVASTSEKDGVRRDQFGKNPNGTMILDEHGRFMLTIIGAGLAPFASGNRAQATAEESRAVVSRTIAMIGRYSVDPASGTLVFIVEAATFPNWAGTAQKRVIVAATGDTLEYITPTASSGGVGRVAWRRLRE